MGRAELFATYVPPIAAIVSLAFGLSQFHQTQKLERDNLRLQADSLRLERESKAVDFLLRFIEVQKEVTGKPLPGKRDVAFWQHSMLLALTESVYRLTEGDSGWHDTVSWMVRSQKAFLEGVPQECNTITPKFLELIKSSVPAMTCE